MIVACGSAETHLRWSSLGKPGGPTPEKSGGPLRRKSGGPQSGNSAFKRDPYKPKEANKPQEHPAQEAGSEQEEEQDLGR